MFWLRALLTIVFLVFLCVPACFCAQESASSNIISNITVNQEGPLTQNLGVPATGNEEAIDLQADESSVNEPEDIKWVWGEVAAIDTAGASIKVKFLDYETDSEADAVFSIDKDTVFENIVSLKDVKIGDSVGIDYNIDKDGKNVIKSISVEKLGGSN